MTLYRKKSSSGKTLPHWYCFFRVPDKNGALRQIHRSTGKRTKVEAEKAARGLHDAALTEAGADSKQARAILAKLTEAGELAMKGHLNPAKARDIINDILTVTGACELKSFSARDYATVWMEAKQDTVSKATLSFYRTVTNRFVAFLKERADAPLESITTEEVRAFRASIHQNSTAKTANHYIVGLRAMFSDAIAEKAANFDPTEPLMKKKGKLKEADSLARHPFTPEEVSLLLPHAPCREWEGMILIGVYTGLRLRDIANLTSSNIKDGTIIVTPMKTASEVTIPLHAALIAYFKTNPPPPFPGTPLFPSLNGKHTGGNTGLSSQFKAIMTAAKLPAQLTRDGKKGTLSFHSLRHSNISWMAKADVSAEIRKKISGHSTDSAHQIYTTLNHQQLQAAVNTLPDLA